MARLALLLMIIGSLNWLLVGLFEWDLVTAIFGGEVYPGFLPVQQNYIWPSRLSRTIRNFVSVP